MPKRPRSDISIVHQRWQVKQLMRGIECRQVQNEAIKALSQVLGLPRPHRALYSAEDILSVLTYAAASSHSIEKAGKDLEGAPSAELVRLQLRKLVLDGVERAVNEALVQRLPKRLLREPLEVAVDLKEIPYYGVLKEEEADFLWRGKAMEGTTRFLVYATLYVIKQDKRFTLALRAVRRSEGVLGALRYLLERFFELGGKVLCLYLDRSFYRVDVIKHLVFGQDLPFCMAVPKKGKRGGTKGL